MIRVDRVRDFGKSVDALEIGNLIEVQTESYARFLQADGRPEKRRDVGLESLFRETFPIESYDGNMQLQYLGYELGRARYTPDECRELRLTYGSPLRIRVRLVRKDSPEIKEDTIYLGEAPIMIGGGEFIVNGAERVIVSQLHAYRVIPERGSWVEVNVTRKDVLAIRIDQSTKFAATCFLRALDEKYGTDSALIREFYKTSTLKVGHLKPDMHVVADVVDPEKPDEVLLPAGSQVGEALSRIQNSSIKSLEVAGDVADPLVINTVMEDTCKSHEEALLKIYTRLRPGSPPHLDKAKKLFDEKFRDDSRYRLGRVGRFRINRKFDQDVPEDVMSLQTIDFVNALKYMMALRSNDPKAHLDDIDHLGNRRLRTIGELATEELRKGLLKLRRTVQERMTVKDPNELTRLAELVNSKSVSSSIEYFFGRGELSQVVDQTNPLSQLTHERRLSALGPGGLNRKRAGFEVRDVHISHYGRICPIETPEGTNIGLISSMSIFSTVDDYGFLLTPYRKVERNKVDGQVVQLRADEEMRGILAPPDVIDWASRHNGRLPETIDKDAYLSRQRRETGPGRGGKFSLRDGAVLARAYGEMSQVSSKEIEYVDVSAKQTVGVSASLIPFLEHDDANRALMGSNMQRQAVPLLAAEPPVVATGMERVVAENSGMVVRSRKDGKITYADALRIVIDDVDEYELRKFRGLNERTCLNQTPLVKVGDRVKKGQIIADGPSTRSGELALGKNVLVAFLIYDGHNFEDAIVISERVVHEDTFTSIHVEDYEVEIRETRLGREEFTRDIPNVSERALRNLDENGIVRIGTRVGPGDILVGKVSPKSKTELTPEEKLLHAIFGRAGEDVKNDSLEMPAGAEGVVIGAKRFSRRTQMTEDQKKDIARKIREFESDCNGKIIKVFKQMVAAMEELTGQVMIDPDTRQKVGKSGDADVLMEQIEKMKGHVQDGQLKWVKPAAMREQAMEIARQYWPRLMEIEEERERKSAQMKRGDELPSGVLEMVKVWVATKRRTSVGDKMAGRHGNKGVIARIVPVEDMPFLEDGTPVDIVLNPLGVPSRMNVGQILETHLGWAAAVLGFQALTPVFDGATEEEIAKCIEEANRHARQRAENIEAVQKAGDTGELFVQMPTTGKITLYDGRTGEPFDQPVAVGQMYMMKLVHLVDDKIHARSTGPYSLITQQPLGGKARAGGQRFGEMEVWALEAYGAAYILQELLTVKSDDVEGRTKIYESMVKGANTLEAGTPVSFDVLCNEIRGLGLNMQLEKKRAL
jgi:DNA-directed RNA polymerase subunit beta